jgi:hypothetical protein
VHHKESADAHAIPSGQRDADGGINPVVVVNFHVFLSVDVEEKKPHRRNDCATDCGSECDVEQADGGDHVGSIGVSREMVVAFKMRHSWLNLSRSSMAAGRMRGS